MAARLFTLTSILISILSQPVGAAPPVPLRPTTNWDLDYGEAHCTALRDYGTEASPITLAIRPSPNGESYEIVVGRKRYGPEFAEEYEGSVDFGNGPIKAWLLHYGAKGKKLSLDQFRISAQEMAAARTASSVTVHSSSGGNLTFSLANMPALLKGLEDCTADLKRYWNFAGPERAKIAVSAKGDIRGLFRSEDYPAEAMKNHQEGRVQFMLLINEQGKVAACHILQASGVPVLDGMGCQVIAERAKFTPALDAQGKPVRSATVTPVVVWKIAS